MSIPLDRLYHYIENIAKEIRGDDTVIYRFRPHGSKKLEDLTMFRDYSDNNYVKLSIQPQIFCYDQEPLCFDLYKSINLSQKFPAIYPQDFIDQLSATGVNWADYNIRSVPHAPTNIYDQCILLHSEQRSSNVKCYSQHGYVPVYYWSHALLALDWYRYAQHQPFIKQTSRKQFLIYNRAWSGTREYRLKFSDLLVEHKLVDQCHTTIGLNDSGVYYKNHQFINSNWKPIHQLELHFKENFTTSCFSADFDEHDYNSTDVEVVLETLFDDPRIHLTEKTLRPIACGQPFILCATHGSLEYLRAYGFQTFNQIFDEGYDTIEDPVERLNAIIKVMKEIANWSDAERNKKLQLAQEITTYNQQHFFSKDFFSKITKELYSNLQSGLELIENTNTSKRFFNERKLRSANTFIKNQMINNHHKTRTEISFIIATARNYYNRYLNTLNK
jgi:hypothetical protein